MQAPHCAVVLAILLATAPLLAAGEPQASLDFALPAAFSGNATLSGGARLLLFTDAAAAPSVVDVHQAAGAVVTNHTVQINSYYSPTSGGVDLPGQGGDTNLTVAGTGETLRLGGRSSLYVEAKSISIHVAGGAAELAAKAKGRPFSQLVPESGPYDRLFRGRAGQDGDVVGRYDFFGATGFAYEVQATGVRTVEWFNATVACDASPCPDGGGLQRQDVRLPPDQLVQLLSYNYEELATTGGSLHAAGVVGLALLGGPSLTLDVDGWVRLPLAKGSTDCDTCELPENQTLQATGTLRLDGIHQAGSGRASAGFSGTVRTAKYDEAAIAPGLLLGASVSVAVVGAVVAGVLVVKGLLAGFFTRRLRDPLSHPVRNAIWAVLAANPGATLREVARITKSSPSQANHHLGILVRNGMAVEHLHGSTRRFFPKAAAKQGWERTVYLREPELSLLHSVVAASPGLTQKDILEVMVEQHGWKRTTAQHRLNRLAKGGLVHGERQGRSVAYVAAE